jgi:hypothetical protein
MDFVGMDVNERTLALGVGRQGKATDESNLVLVREVILGRVSHKPSRQHRTGEPEVVFTQLKSRKTRFTLTSFLHLVLSVIRFRRR